MSGASIPAPGPDQIARLDYIGRKPCGCPVAWVAADLDRADLAPILAKWIRGGLSIERATVEWARMNVRRCRCEAPTLPEDFEKHRHASLPIEFDLPEGE